MMWYLAAWASASNVNFTHNLFIMYRMAGIRVYRCMALSNDPNMFSIISKSHFQYIHLWYKVVYEVFSNGAQISNNVFFGFSALLPELVGYPCVYYRKWSGYTFVGRLANSSAILQKSVQTTTVFSRLQMIGSSWSYEPGPTTVHYNYSQARDFWIW